MSPDSTSSEDYDFETAIAAGAFAAATFREPESEPEPEPEASQTKNKSTGDGRGGPPESSKDSLKKPELVYCKPPENTVTNEIMRVAVKGTTRTEKKANAWEKSEMAKIRKRYDKQYSMILSWEYEKMAKARRHLDKIEGTLKLRKEKANEAYVSEVANITMIAREARAMADESKRNAESKIKDKANKIISTGRAPTTCCCF
ncbi:hepatoma-derived growth factor-related protein 2 isoform X1 [Cinnamomum micranthum f. kanehirae]|uniref:Hepatoma-derived growth factor-related protein 2 isoform X1 n=1 Tax=Cinnamomum micranthum f. kanehirae TaxID=337451 RepID=A0A443NFD6_9MAGN|nr:hepatoma-derived growth factor-related protein 2 isoform X1 [Cinnamomum micranthum f. kanehirae]